MSTHDEEIKLATEKLHQAEGALYAYAGGTELDHERIKQLAQAVLFAKRQLRDLLFDQGKGDETAASPPKPR